MRIFLRGGYTLQQTSQQGVNSDKSASGTGVRLMDLVSISVLQSHLSFLGRRYTLLLPARASEVFAVHSGTTIGIGAILLP